MAKIKPCTLLRYCIATLLVAFASLVLANQPDAERSIKFSGPVEGGQRGYAYSASIVDLATYGYVEEEYFVSGTAHSYLPVAGTTLDRSGKWRVEAGEDVPFTTRMLVRKPQESQFNGTVVVEFMQEYFGSERDTNFRWVAEALLSRGFVWVGVSLHHEGIDDDSPQQEFEVQGTKVTTGITLKRWDPERYAHLSVPSSDLGYDILSQVASALRTPAKGHTVSPLGALQVEAVLAVGNTVAAKRLGIYLNAVQNQDNAFDGIYLQDWTPDGMQLSGSSEPPEGYRLRKDLRIPVMIMNTTTASVELGPLETSPNVRFWTPAGSSHTTGFYMQRVGEANFRDLGVAGQFCPLDIANRFPVRYFARSALIALNQWVRSGLVPPTFPQLKRIPTNEGWDTPRDQYGNSIGGLRSPWVDVPIEQYEWRSDCPGGAGTHTKFERTLLSELYGSPANFQARFVDAMAESVAAGTVLPEDAEAAINAARSFTW